MKCKTRQLLAIAGLAAAVAAPHAFALSLQTLDAGGGLYLTQIGPRASVREPSGRVSELSLPPGATMRRIEPLAAGWIAAGEVDASGLTELFLILDEAGTRRPFPAPPNLAEEPLRAGPMPMVENGRLVGLAWLAGARVRQTAVWAARWSGLDWSQPELVSPVGAGTQIAIDGAVLADGSWLLVWSAYDGEDDEILWSRRVGDRWSEPERLHEENDWPDITPAVVTTGRGALAAWSSFDGTTYRVRLARLEEGAWEEIQPDSRPVGAKARLTPRDGGAHLLYRTAVPPTWTIVELDEFGSTLRSAGVESASPVKPALVTAQDGSLSLGWPGDEGTVPQSGALEWRVDP